MEPGDRALERVRRFDIDGAGRIQESNGLRRIDAVLQDHKPVLSDRDVACAAAAADVGIHKQLAAAGGAQHAIVGQPARIRLHRQPVAGLIGNDAALVVERILALVVPRPEPGISVNAAIAVDHRARVDRRGAGGRPNIIEIAAEQIDAGGEVVVAGQNQLHAAERGDRPARTCAAVQRKNAAADCQAAGDGDAIQLVQVVPADGQVAANQRAVADAAPVQRQATECSIGKIDRAVAVVEAGL